MPKQSKKSGAGAKGPQQGAKRAKGQGRPNQNIPKYNKIKAFTAPQSQLIPTRQFRGAKGTGLSNCAELYAKAIINPFGRFTELPCVPCTPADMTYRFRTLTRGSFQTGTIGTGFVSWAPLCAANDISSTRGTLTTFAGTTFALAGATVSGNPKTNLPYANPAFNTAPNLKARLVASGIRLLNTTSDLYRQGNITACRAGTGDRLADIPFTTFSQNMENVRVSANQKGWMYWSFIPQDEEDYDFPDGPVNYIVDTVGNRAAQNFGLFVSGAVPANPSTFEWELVEFWEFAGATATINPPNLTRSDADPVGHSRVLEAVAVPRQSLHLPDIAETYSRSMIESMANSDSAAKTVEDLLGLSGLSMGTITSLTSSLVKMLLS